MANLDYKPFSERRRPHIHPAGATLFVTYRLAGSVAQGLVRAHRAKKEWLEDQLERARRATRETKTFEAKKWLERVEAFHREWFVKFEDALHKAENGPVWMKDDRVATRVAMAVRDLDGDAYRLDAYCVMSNHVHVVFTPLLSEAELQASVDNEGHLIFVSKHPGLSRIMQLIKGRTARECNLILCRSGQFWEHESFDHVVRAGRLMATIRYVLNNPVKAGLVKDWRQWRWSYCRSECPTSFSLSVLRTIPTD